LFKYIAKLTAFVLVKAAACCVNHRRKSSTRYLNGSSSSNFSSLKSARHLYTVG